MFVVTPSMMGDVDRKTIDKIGIPGIVLMENAAIKVVNEIQKEFAAVDKKRFVVLAGKGNNGGDAMAVARHLFNMGGKVRVFLCTSRDQIKGDAFTNLKILENMKLSICEVNNKSDYQSLVNDLTQAELIVDGIFGTGLKGTIRGQVKDIIDAVNNSGKPVISLDIPSGVNGETGMVEGVCIKAYKTITFGLPKIGEIIHPGCEYTGKLIVADIGFPEMIINDFSIRTRIITLDYVRDRLPQRALNTNKGDYGKVLVIAGSKGMTGAGCLASKACLRTGSGLVYFCVPESLTNICDLSVPEAVICALGETKPGYIGLNSLNMLDELLKKADTAVVGPGLTVFGEVPEVVNYIIRNSDIPLVLDADALNAISGDISILKRLKANAVLTPHPGEMSRLTGLSIAEIQKDRIGIAKRFAKEWNVYLVLKGSRTIIAWPDESIYINVTGNSGMSTAGAGDVLSGIIASMIGQGMDAGNAAVAGVFLHGLSGDNAAKLKGEHGLIAGDIVEEIPKAIKYTAEF